jgi:ESS family glutamate:Na+ symporter
MENFNFWDSEVWGFVCLISVLLLSLLVANLLKKSIRLLRVSLIPTSVLGGIILLLISVVYQSATGKLLFDSAFFGGNGMATMEIITYHCLALGFIATTFRSKRRQKGMRRTVEVFNTGVTTVATYLLQGILGLGITLLAALIIKDFFAAAGILLPFGYGQGTGQALNYGNIYETENGFVGGRSFGLTVAALGFLSAAIGGVIHLNILKKKGKIAIAEEEGAESMSAEQIQSPDEIPMNGSIDKMTVQIAIILAVYMVAYGIICLLSKLLPGFRSVLYGFNFLFGVLMATVLKWALDMLRRANIVKKEYINPFLMNRMGGFFFDLMIVAGVAAIRLDYIKQYWHILLILGIVGAVSTYWYNHFVAKTLFPRYCETQFMAMYGMLTGTASTGMILLREVDPEFKTPVADNLVYQNLPAIVFGFPMMLLATLAPSKPKTTLVILVLFFVVMNLILFRTKIFRRRRRCRTTNKEK